MISKRPISKYPYPVKKKKKKQLDILKKIVVPGAWKGKFTINMNQKKIIQHTNEFELNLTT